MSQSYAVAAVPPIAVASGGLAELGRRSRRLTEGRRAALILDAMIMRLPIGPRAVEALSEAGFDVAVYDAISGEPKIDHVRAAARVAFGADIVIGLGGGSALDVAKIAAALSRDDRDPLVFAGAAEALPAAHAPSILVPTTAGTGSESSSTAIFTGSEGRKLWIWGAETKPSAILLDPELTVSVPPAITAFTGLDAIVHAFEAATNRHTNPGAQLYAHRAMALAAEALPRAVADPGDLGARGDLLLAACWAGTAIDNCGTAVAHLVSHAMAGLAPVPHGLATALAFEATLPWLVETPTPDLERAAAALGLESARELPRFVGALMDRAGIERRLPGGFSAVTAEAFAAEMRAPENAPMRAATCREIGDAEIERFSAAMLALAPAPLAPGASGPARP